MENFEDLPLEVRLSAYIDGQVEPEQKRQLEALLATDPHARELLDLLKAGSDLGNQAFADMLNEPVPLHLVRSIKSPSSSTTAMPRKADNSNVASFFRFVPQAIAASAVLLLAGGYSGYFLGMKSASQMPTEITETAAFEAPPGGEAKTRGFTFNAASAVSLPSLAVTAVADVHDVYSRQTSRLGEMSASDTTALKTWLAQSTGVSFEIPDLTASGLSFEGGRLVAVGATPTGALFYKDTAGRVVGLYFAKGAVDKGSLMAGDNEFLSGSKGETAWVVAGPSYDKSLAAIAAKASAAL